MDNAALPIQVALASGGIATSAHAQTPQATSKLAGWPNPLFPDDVREFARDHCAPARPPASLARVYDTPESMSAIASTIEVSR
jgi:hypothetical protein